ncbi:NH(3)-dependent NAD(+) synthetase [Streptomyces tanashiensis]
MSERCAREARYTEYTEHEEARAGAPTAGDLMLDAAALAGLLALTTGRPMAAYVVVGHVLDAARGGPADSAARLRCHLVRVFALTGLGRLAEARERALRLRALCEELDEWWTRIGLAPAGPRPRKARGGGSARAGASSRHRRLGAGPVSPSGSTCATAFAAPATASGADERDGRGVLALHRPAPARSARPAGAAREVHRHRPRVIGADQVLTVDVKASSDAALEACLAGGVTFRDAHHQDFVQGNIKARQRMIAQYAVAGAHDGLVVGTDHAAEAVSGFFTKFGDGAADVVPLTGLTKRRVRAIADELGAPAELVWKTPTADRQWPTIIALVLFAVPPLLTNAYVGMRVFDADVVRAARGMGMTGRQTLTLVELPLALPMILTGVRIAAVQLVATATVAALAGGGGLGRIITAGFNLASTPQVVAGAFLVAVLALLVEAVFEGALRVGPARARARGSGG